MRCPHRIFDQATRTEFGRSRSRYQTVGQDIDGLEAYPMLSMPVLGVSGISTPFLKTFLDRYPQHATMMEFKATGHWIPEERPAETIAAILEFLGRP